MTNHVDFPIQIRFDNLAHSDAIDSKAHQYAKKLGQYFSHIMRCEVRIDTSHHQHKGHIYHVGIHVHVPRAELVVNRDPSENHAHEDVYVALRDAFDAMKRQLIEHAQKLRS